ncbi:dihydrolipoyl dehydrogenase [soil metagenome]
MKSPDYDFAVIGGGSAGYAAARTAAGLGLKTVVVEGGQEVGGLCILRGCMPSKTLIESANRFLAISHAKEFGLKVENPTFDASAIIARKRRLIGEFADYRKEQLEAGKFDFIRAHASFTDPSSLRLRLLDGSEQTISARAFLIATGSSISSPSVPGLAEAACLTSDDLLDLETLPTSTIVLGAGPVALELAHYLAALGTEVTIVQRSDQLLKGIDPDLAEVVEKAFLERGIKIYKNTSLTRVERVGDTRRVVFQQEGTEIAVEAASVFNALGRQPNVSRLALERAGVVLDGKQIKVEPSQQTSAAHIFAAGDCCGPYEVVHTAIEQGELAARNAAHLLKGDPQRYEMDYRLKLYVVFTEPQVASVGLTEAEARAQRIPYHVATYPFNDHGKSLVMNELHGFVKLLSDQKTGKIIGGSVVGPHASDLIHEIVVAMAFRATACQLALVPHYHPTLSEIWTYPAGDLAELYSHCQLPHVLPGEIAVQQERKSV